MRLVSVLRGYREATFGWTCRRIGGGKKPKKGKELVFLPNIVAFRLQ
jgi:hypothetical protein